MNSDNEREDVSHKEMEEGERMAALIHAERLAAWRNNPAGEAAKLINEVYRGATLEWPHKETGERIVVDLEDGARMESGEAAVLGIVREERAKCRVTIERTSDGGIVWVTKRRVT